MTLNSLNDWSDKWLLRFHPDKCKHMHIGKVDPNLDHKYSLNQTNLETINSEKDIGVHIDDELTFDKHISEKVNKANSIFAMLRRSFQYMDKESFTPLYKTLVRTHLDYANSVWAPFKIKHIDLIENVQRRATKQLPGMKDMSYPERLKILKLPTLSYRRTRGDMIEVYKILNKIYDPEVCGFLKLLKDMAPRSSNRGNSMKLYPQRCNSNTRKNSFTIRIVQTWNNLPENIVKAPTLNAFKNRLDRYWCNQELMYNDYKSKIDGKHCRLPAHAPTQHQYRGVRCRGAVRT